MHFMGTGLLGSDVSDLPDGSNDGRVSELLSDHSYASRSYSFGKSCFGMLASEIVLACVVNDGRVSDMDSSKYIDGSESSTRTVLDCDVPSRIDCEDGTRSAGGRFWDNLSKKAVALSLVHLLIVQLEVAGATGNGSAMDSRPHQARGSSHFLICCR